MLHEKLIVKISFLHESNEQFTSKHSYHGAFSRGVPIRGFTVFNLTLKSSLLYVGICCITCNQEGRVMDAGGFKFRRTANCMPES